MDSFAPSPAGSPLHDAKVMMVDDDPLLTDVVQAHLDDQGFRDFVATNDPCAALALMRQERPRVLLLDLVMPQMSGFDLLQAIRADAEFGWLPVIVLTAETGPKAKLRALQLGATDFLAKPVDESELVLRVRNTLAYQAYHDRLIHQDPVTGLPNRRAFERGLDGWLGRDGAAPALFSITVPECRLLRQSLDQATADELSRVLAGRLSQLAAAWPTTRTGAGHTEAALRVARLGNDRFGLLLPADDGAEILEQRGRALLAALAEPVQLGCHDVVPTPWLGIAIAPHDGHRAELLCQSAELASNHARERGAGHLAFASAELNARSHRRMTLGLQLRGAVQREELQLHYQPKLDMASGRIVGAEALVRWQHPEHGLLGPDRFIGLAEELGLIDGIGTWVLQQACRDAAGWTRAGLGRPAIAVNVSKPQFETGMLAATVRQALAASGLMANRLVLELTESMFMDDMDKRLVWMHALKSLGLKLSIDDFGTGYSSLAYLKRFPVDELKIDRSFVVDLPGGHADLSIVQSVVDLGHRLGMRVVAEGVERQAQLDCLRACGCDQFQGLLFSRPVNAEAFAALLAQSGASEDRPVGVAGAGIAPAMPVALPTQY